MKILFIRHGETDVNASGVMPKIRDPEGLNENGRKQSASVAEACMKAGVDVIYTSPEKRAMETAEIIGGILGLKPVVMDGLQERNFGEWSGKSWSEMKEFLGKMEFQERYTYRPLGGESWRDAESRLTKVINRVVQSESSAIAIVTHMGSVQTLMPILKDELKDTSYKYVFDNGSITSFEYKDGKYTEFSVNDTSHLQ